jgi:methyl-accepting chemotaxis protein
MNERNRSLAPAPRRVRRPPVGFQALALVGVVVAVLAASIVIAVPLIISLSRDHAELQDKNIPYAVAISTAALHAKGMANHERGFLISGDREFLEEFEQGLLDVRTAFAAAVVAADGERQADAVSKAHAGFEDWVWAVRGELKTYQAGNRQAATATALGRVRALRKSYEASLAEAQTVASSAIRLRNNPLASREWVAILLMSLLVMLAICVALTLWLVRTLNFVSGVDEQSEPLPATVPLSASSVVRQRRNG